MGRQVEGVQRGEEGWRRMGGEGEREGRGEKEEKGRGGGRGGMHNKYSNVNARALLLATQLSVKMSIHA